MKTKGITIIEAVVLVITTAVLAMAMLGFSVNAEELASSTSNSILQSYKHEKDSSNIKPASDNSTMTKAEILKQSGVPGKGIDHAPGLHKPFNPSSNAADHADMKKFFSNWQHRFQEMIRRYFGKTR